MSAVQIMALATCVYVHEGEVKTLNPGKLGMVSTEDATTLVKAGAARAPDSTEGLVVQEEKRRAAEQAQLDAEESARETAEYQAAKAAAGGQDLTAKAADKLNPAAQQETSLEEVLGTTEGDAAPAA